MSKEFYNYLKLKRAWFLVLVNLVFMLPMQHLKAQNDVSSGGELAVFASLDLATSPSWTTDRAAIPGYFAWVSGSTLYSGQDDSHNINGYVKKYGADAFVFPVGTGSDLRTLTMSAPATATDAYATAWIVGNPSTTGDPTNANAMHSTTSFSGLLVAVSPVGQWDWQAISGTGAGLTITLSIPTISGAGLTVAADLRLVGWNGTTWVNLGTAGASGLTENSTLSGTMIAGIQAIGIGAVDTTPPLPPTIDTVTPNPNGTLAVSGTAEPGSTVAVTFPDGSTGTAVTDLLGNYGPVNSLTPQTSGTITANATDVAGNVSPNATAPYVDVTPPLAPTITTVAANPNGTVAVSGTAEPGSTVTVTFPDGSTGTAVANASGNYGPVTSLTPQTSGTITANAKDVAGNVSPNVTAPYVDVTAPLAPTITTVAANPNGTVAVSGTAEPGSTVTVKFPDGSTGTAVANASGNYGPITSLTPQTSGTITANATDVAGNVSPNVTAPYVDVTVPLAPTITTVAANPNGTVAVSGTAEPGSTVTVTFPDGSIGTAVANASGNYGPVTSLTPQTSGTITANATDVAGNVSPNATAPYVDVTAPLAPTITTVAANPNGTVAVSGTAEPGSTVTVTFPDGSIGTAVANASGNYGPITSLTPQTSGTITANATDVAGNVSPNVTAPYVDVTAPLAPTITTVTANPNGTVAVSGTAEPGSTVTVTFPDGSTGTAVANASGNYGPITSLTPQTSGTITANAKDVAGNVSPNVTAPYVDVTPPLAPTITTVTANPNGTVAVSGTAEPGSTVTVTFPDGSTGTAVANASGNYGPITSLTPQTSGTITANAKDVAGNVSPNTTVPYVDNTPPLAPTIAATANPNGTLSVSGTAEPGSTVTVTFPDGSTGTAVANASGNYGPITSLTPQTSGTITANAKDVAGNVSPNATAPYVDVTAPLAPTITTVAANPNGTVAVSGTAEPGSTVTVTFPDGSTSTAVANASGNYGPITSLTPQTSGTITANAKDVAGNVSPNTTVPYVDVTPPLAPTIVTVTAHANGKISVSGTAEPGSTVTVTFPDGSTGTAIANASGNYGPITSLTPQTSGTITAIATDVAGNVSPKVTFLYVDVTAPPLPPTVIVTANPNGTISVSGKTEPGSTVTVTFPDGSTGTAVADPSGNYGPITSLTPQTSGTIIANAKDAAGNVSPNANVPYVDVTPPLAPTIIATANPNGTVSVSGTAEPGSTVTVTFPDGSTGTAVANASGNYGPITSLTPQTSGTISANAKDVAGNVSPNANVTYVDVTPPLAPTIIATANANGTVSVSGTAEPGSTVTVTFPDGSTGTAIANASGNYGPITSLTPQTGGTITANAKDAAGNVSSNTTIPYVDARKASMSFVKTADFNDKNQDGYAQAGETITYSFSIKNTGNVPLTGVVVTDILKGLVLTGGPIPVLAAGFTDNTTYKGIYTITQTDVNLGKVTNQAIATGKSPNGAILSVLSNDSEGIGEKPTVLPISGCVIEAFKGMSPNGDGQNDVFYIRGLECYPDNSVEIYNRYGVLVFNAEHYNNVDNAFTGVSQGKGNVSGSEGLPVGTYYYIIKYKDNEGNGYQKAGYLYINR
jgi:gliding motility-associated-like protein